MAQTFGTASVNLANSSSNSRLIAPLWHTIIFVLLVAGLSVSSNLLTKRFVAGGTLSSEARLTIYAVTLAEEWFLFLYVWLAMRRRGLTARRAINARWGSARAVWSDIGLGLLTLVGFFAIEALGSAIFRGQIAAASRAVAQLAPHYPADLCLWVPLSISGGFCEEFLFRGYLQEQARRLTGSTAAGIFVQALLFGGGHGYQGWALMITIVFIGLFFGIVAAWRKSLAPTMITHGVADTIGGVANVIAIAMHKM